MYINKKNMNEYEQLKKWAKKQKIRTSVRDTEFLVDDIDFPIRRCVAMIALLGCKPVFSCCGFDYAGQPFHKSHQYGHPYIKITSNPESAALFYSLSFVSSMWVAKTSTRGYIDIEHKVNGNPYWRQEECIHFSEECVLAINWLERFLLTKQNNMMDEVILEDTNDKALRDTVYWQYTPKKSWCILKSDFIEIQSQV